MLWTAFGRPQGGQVEEESLVAAGLAGAGVLDSLFVELELELEVVADPEFERLSVR
jgi:hypothetical protein